MKIFPSKNIVTQSHLFIGIEWTFNNCNVIMNSEGFACTCMKRPREKCDHIKSVEMGILGINFKSYNIENN